MHVILEGDQLSGKTTIASELRRHNRLLTIIENRGLASIEENSLIESHILPHFKALRAFTDVAFQPCIILRGPLSAYANGLIDSASLRRILFEIIGESHFGIFWLDITFKTYIEHFDKYHRNKGFRPHTCAEFEERRRRYIEASTLFSGFVQRTSITQENYRTAASEIAKLVGWDDISSINENLNLEQNNGIS